MTFAGLNYLAVLIAAVVAWIAGAVWYMSLAKPWRAAIGISAEKMEELKKRPGAHLPFIYVFVAELIMAWVLAGLMGHLGGGQVTLLNGVISGAFCWLGSVLPAHMDRRRLLARRARADGRHHRRHGRVNGRMIRRLRRNAKLAIMDQVWGGKERGVRRCRFALYI
jgi:Protein of unknown function (DUF1761)